MSVTAYRRFSKATHRITVLYEVTIDSYRLLYDAGRNRLKSEDAATAVHEVRLEDRSTRRRPLAQLTFHAKDVYPQMLRSTLLIRLVAAYEAYLTDALRELAERSSDFLKTDQRVDLSQAHLISLAEDQEVEEFIMSKALRSLSSGGFKETAKFYKKMSIDVCAPGVSLTDIEEVHDRRHLYVHRGGTADDQYCSRYPSMGAVKDVRLPVDENYLFEAIKLLEESARHVRNQLDARFPIQTWSYGNGAQTLSSSLEHLNLFSGKVVSGTPLDLNLLLPESTAALRDVTIWVGRFKDRFKLLVGGTGSDATLYSKFIHLAEIRGELAKVTSEKLKR